MGVNAWGGSDLIRWALKKTRNGGSILLLALKEDPQPSDKITALDGTLISAWWDLEQRIQLAQMQTPPKRTMRL